MSSPSASSGPLPPISRKPPRSSKRTKLKNATFVIPSTRQRVKRQITLRNTDNFDGPARTSSNESGDSLPYHRRASAVGTLETAIHNTTISLKNLWKWFMSPAGKGVLKCSLAYMLGCMGTFLPFLSNFLGQQDGKHMVATIAVYFNPARSAGSMVEAVILGVVAFLYAVFISVSSMAVSVLCETQFGLIELGYFIVLVVFCGGGLGFVGWIKQKFNQPLVSVACSLASLATITILTKENAVQTAVFSNNKIAQMMKMIIMGILCTTIVNLLVWPVSARRELRKTMISVTDAFGDALTTITRSFLSGNEADLQSEAWKSAASKYKLSFIKLSQNLKESKAEHYILGTEKEYEHEAKLVNCMQRLSQAIGGLRSAAMTQFTLLREPIAASSSTQTDSVPSSQVLHGLVAAGAKGDRFSVLTAIDEHPDEVSDVEERPKPTNGTETSHTSDLSSMLPTVRTPAEIFERFITHLGPSMKSMAYTLYQILQNLPFGEGPEFKITINEHFRVSLKDAISLYSDARAAALKELYESKEMGTERSETIEADFEEVAASCGHFSFSLLDFAEEMENYLEILEDLKFAVEQPGWRTWSWLKFWRRMGNNRNSSSETDPERERLIVHTHENSAPKNLKDMEISRRGTLKTLGVNSTRQSIASRILAAIRFLQRDDIKFSLKVGTGAALWAMISFIPATRPFYARWRGEWGLLSYMLVCSMTMGASNTTGYSRFIGTLIGATIAVVVWVTCQGNPFALAFCGWIVCLPCFYLIVAKGKAPFGRFILLTYNLSCLYAYSLSIKEGKDDEDEGGVNPIISEIALHRVVSVMGGCLWGMIVTRLIWPISARQKFKDGLSVLWLRMGLIWKRDPLAAIVEGDTSKAYMNFREEFALQQYIASLEKLRAASASEFELRGPFPAVECGRIMESTIKMLDAFHSMNVVIQKDLKASPGEAAILKFTENERVQLCARISHLFQVLASSMKLEYPLTDDLPSTVNSRDRLLAKIYHYRKDEAEKGEGTKDEDYALLYAYVLVTGQLAEEIEKVERQIEALYGVLDEELIQLY